MAKLSAGKDPMQFAKGDNIGTGQIIKEKVSEMKDKVTNIGKSDKKDQKWSSLIFVVKALLKGVEIVNIFFLEKRRDSNKNRTELQDLVTQPEPKRLKVKLATEMTTKSKGKEEATEDIVEETKKQQKNT